MDINEWMVEQKIAKNIPNAQAIFNGLELYKVKDDSVRIERCRLYRKWRNAGENRKASFTAAIEGKDAPKSFVEDAFHCPDPRCGDLGWYMEMSSNGEANMVQCEFCLTNQNSYYNRKGK